VKLLTGRLGSKVYNDCMIKQSPNWLAEIGLWQKGYQAVIGLDEVGTGAWAGPLVVAAVACPADLDLKNDLFKKVRDSKILSAEMRGVIVREAGQLPFKVGYGWTDEKLIDELGLAEAWAEAMRSALESVWDKSQKNYILVDGNRNFQTEGEVECVVDGDAKCFSIALASIFAKVARDSYMHDQHEKYPHYGFRTNVGYGTKEHQNALWQFGVCPLHRRSYEPVAEVIAKQF